MQSPSQTSLEARQTRNASTIAGGLLISAIPASALFLYLGAVAALPKAFLLAAFLLVTVLIDIVSLSLIRRGRKDLAMALLIASHAADISAAVSIIQGLGVLAAFAIGLIVASIARHALSPKYAKPGISLAVVSGAAVFALDLLMGPGRAPALGLSRYTPVFMALVAAPFAFVFIREYRQFNLQVKITLGILLTGGIAVVLISLFALNQAQNITTLLAGRVETGVRLLAEEELINTVEREAWSADEFFTHVAHIVDDLAGQRAALQAREDILNQGKYWDASQSLIQLDGGQYGNSTQDISSVFVPATLPLDEATLAELNASAYLDFSAPHNLEETPGILAVYTISSRGIIRYYPNIELASLLPPDFDGTQRPYYEIATPSSNPERLPRWAVPYMDAAGGGLVVTVAAPIYYDDTFAGIVAADIQLSEITKQLSSIKIGQSGFAFMVDGAGRPIYLPPAGYEMFEIAPDGLSAEEYDSFTIRGRGSDEVQAFTEWMMEGGEGLKVIQVNGVETYVSFAPIPSTGYSLGLAVPAAEMQTAIVATRAEIQEQLRAATQTALIILISTFLGALFVSIALGQRIASPVRRLTETAKRIAGGDLSARADVIPLDETGVLARTFNDMADRLTDTLKGLEERIADRTRELLALSESSVRRASQFEAIARISHAIGSTRNLDQLFQQIVETISDQLGYYHVGIFLADAHKEYAMLVAANSEGGKAMLARGHRLRIGETGIVGFAAQSGAPRVALDVGKDAEFFNNPDLRETRSEIALPLKSGTEIIGALDVQSKVANAFSGEDVNILSVLADHVSIAIQNARSYQQSQESLSQAERTAAHMSEQQWSQFLAKRRVDGFHYDGVSVRQIKPGEKTRPNSLAIPIILRGVQIGTLKLNASDPERMWDNNEIALAQSTAERTALAIETARLLEEAQRRAAKERAIRQISAEIGGLINIDNIVQTTIQELGNNMPGTEVVIQFKPGQTL